MVRKAAIHIVGPVRLYQRGRYWHAAYTMEGERVRQSLKVSNLKVAERKAREIADLVEHGDYATLQDRREQRRSDFAEFVHEFKSKHNNWSATTWQGANGIIKRVTTEWGHLPLTGINTRMIEEYITRRLDQDNVTNATVNRHLACIKTMFKMAVRWGYVTRSPAEAVKTLKETPRVPRALSDSEIAALLDDLPEHAGALAITALDTGMRRGELFGLRWNDVDLERNTVTVRHSKNNEFRVIPMTNRVQETLLKQWTKGQIPFVFPGKDGGPTKSVKDALVAAGKRTGIGHIHLHMFRHTFATRLREQGVPLGSIMELLGHKTMVMTLRYAKSSPTQLHSAIEALNQAPALDTRQG